MRLRRLIAFLVAAGLLAVACSGGAPTQQSTQPGSPQPTAGQSSSATTKPSSAGSVGGTLESVSMPTGTAYDPWKPLKIGDAIDLPVSGLVLQVTGAKTVDYDADRDMLLVDLIIGNKSKDKYTVSSVTMMEAVTSDWHWYGLSIDELMKAATKIAALNIKTFDTDLAPGGAIKGTAVIPVPKSSQQLAFAFSPLNLTNPIGDSDPTVYVSLGIKGDFQAPLILQDATAVRAGSTYKIGQAILAPKRGVVVQVNSVRERTDSLPDYKINATDKLVIVDVTMKPIGNVKPFATQELSLADSAGNGVRSIVGDTMSVTKGEQTRSYSAAERRGVLVYTTPRDAKGFSLRVRPIDSKSDMARPIYFDDELIVVDLGGAPFSSSGPATGAATAVPTKPAASGSPIPTRPGGTSQSAATIAAILSLPKAPSDATNCGNDLDCFIKAAQTSHNAGVDWIWTMDFFGVLASNTDTMLITGKEGDKLLFSFRITDGSATLSEEGIKQLRAMGKSDADMLQVIDQAKMMDEGYSANVGTGKDCKFASADLTAMLKRWQAGEFSSSDWEKAQCTDVSPVTGGSASQIVATPRAVGTAAAMSSPTPRPAGTARPFPTATARPAADATPTPARSGGGSQIPIPAEQPNGLKLFDASMLPAELKSLPIPPGFGVAEGTGSRSARGGIFAEARAQLWGLTRIEDVMGFYNLSLSANWNPDQEDVGQGYFKNRYISKSDSSVDLYVDGEVTGDGTTVRLDMEKN